MGHGLLRYLRDDRQLRERLRGLPHPEVSFLYLGRFDPVVPESGWLAPTFEATGPLADPDGLRTHVLDVSGAVAGGQLQLAWHYSENLHARPTIERLAAGLVEALHELAKPAASLPRAYTPGDFPAARLDQRSLKALLTTIGRPGEGSV